MFLKNQVIEEGKDEPIGLRQTISGFLEPNAYFRDEEYQVTVKAVTCSTRRDPKLSGSYAETL